jgi:hypothetical protein
VVTAPDKYSIQPRDKTDSVMKEDTQLVDHKHGEMDIQVQQKTFDGFVKYVTWSVVVIIGVLIFTALVNG